MFCSFVKFVISEAPRIIPHSLPLSSVSFLIRPCPSNLWPPVPAPGRCFNECLLFASPGPKDPTGPHVRVSLFHCGSGSGLTETAVHLWCLGSVGCRDRGKGEGERKGKRASTVIRLSSGVVPKPSLHVHSPFKNLNKYEGGDKPRGPPPWLLQRLSLRRAPNPLARVTRGSASGALSSGGERETGRAFGGWSWRGRGRTREAKVSGERETEECLATNTDSRKKVDARGWIKELKSGD